VTVQYSVAVRDAKNDAYETTIGEAPILEIRSGAQPANCAAADTGTLLVSMTLPTDWMGASSSGVKAKSGTWEDSSANATGTAGHYRMKNAAGSVCHEQGSVTLTGGDGDMTINNTSIVSGQPVSVTSFSKTAGNV
jgi:hypothetical protein